MRAIDGDEIVRRFRAGESMQELSASTGLKVAVIEQVVRAWMLVRKAPRP